MRKLSTLFSHSLKCFMVTALCVLAIGQGLRAQPNWEIAVCSGGPPAATTANTYGPMYTTATANATSRTASIYPASQLTGIASANLTKIYFHKGTATSALAGSPNFKVYLKEVSNLDWGTGSVDWATEIANATLVYSGNPASTVGTAIGWKGFDLTTSFPYSGTGNLAVLMEYSNTAAGTTINWSYEYTGPCVVTTNNNTTKYTNNTTGALSATLATANYRRPYIGFDFFFIPCDDPSVVMPASGTTTVSITDICHSGNVDLGIVPISPLPAAGGLTYQWQTSPNPTGPWTDLGTPTNNPTFTATPTADAYFRCKVLCNGNDALITSASNKVSVNDPSLTNTTDGTRCGHGVVTLSATAPANTQIRWYANPTGGAPLGTGNTFTTPFITNTTPFYAAAVSGDAPDSIAVPLATGNTTGVYHHMFMVRAQNTILVNKIGIKCNNTIGTLTDWDIYYRPNNYQTVTGANTSATGWTLLSSVTGVASAGPNDYTTISVPMGVSIPAGETHSFYIAPVGAAAHQYGGNAIGTVVTNNLDAEIVAGNRGSSLFNCTTSGGIAVVKLGYSVGCEGSRIPVQATVTPPPALVLDGPQILCSESVGTLKVTSPLSNYSNYSWTPVTDLYTDPAATVPYTGGNVSTVYFKSNVAGPYEYYQYATNTSGQQCASLDTLKFWVQPGDLVIKAQPDTICINGNSQLSLVPAEGYFAGSIQWQQSPDNITYTDIPGANAPTYTTPNLSFGQNTYYKAIINGQVQACEAPMKLVVVSNPTLTGTMDSFNCGPGKVHLAASTAGNAIPRWYDVPTGGAPIGVGEMFETPFLLATKTFYVGAAGGSALASVGKPNITSTTGNTGTSTGIVFNALSHVHIASVAVYPYATTPGQATITVQLRDAANTVLQTFTDNINVTTTTPTVKVVLPIAFDVNAGTGYRLVWASSTGSLNGLGRESNTADFSFPYTLPGLISLTNSTSTGFYYYFYDWMVETMCETSRQPVTAFIRPLPEIDLGNDINRCMDLGEPVILNAGVQPNNPSYLWEDGSTSQIRSVESSGIYSVEVENEYGCIGYDTIEVILRKNPVVELGNDTVVCNGVSLWLDAGTDGLDYYWSTGSTEKKIPVHASGSYYVFVTNSEGCIKSDTIQVTMNGELPTVDGIYINNNGENTFTFNALNPQNVIGYEWDFGDGSAPSYSQRPTHTYAAEGIYTVTLKLSSSCGFGIDSMNANIVGIEQVRLDHTGWSLYPNPSNGTATIENKGTSKMQRIEVYNLLGQLVYARSADSADRHVLDLQGISSGTYTITVYTDQGRGSKKLEVVR